MFTGDHLSVLFEALQVGGLPLGAVSSIGSAANRAGEIIFIKHPTLSGVNKDLCVFFAVFDMYSAWMKLLFTLCVTFHLFCFVFFYKNLKRLETTYVLISLLTPAVLAAIPVITHTYGLSGSWCWKQNWKDNCPSDVLDVGVIEQFSLYYGPSMAILTFTSLAMVAMVIILLRRVYTKRILYDQNWNALRQLLPLTAFPTLFFVLTIPPFINRLYGIGLGSQSSGYGLSVTTAFFVAGWSLLAGLILITHITISRLRRRANQHRSELIEDEEAPIVQKESITCESSNTVFTPPSGSISMS